MMNVLNDAFPHNRSQSVDDGGDGNEGNAYEEESLDFFQNAFELAFFVWVTMGSNFKSAALEEHTVKAMRQWHAEVKEIRKKNHTSQSAHNNNDYSSSTLDHMSNSATISPDHPVSSHHTRSPTFADQLTRFSIDTEIVEDYCQEIGLNIELDISVALSSTVDERLKKQDELIRQLLQQLNPPSDHLGLFSQRQNEPPPPSPPPSTTMSKVSFCFNYSLPSFDTYYS
ncbi:hypothetical protein TIFTF001_033054 [Ficus carica]|uniref:Uncharacterized protein n=1 Tax=Ficus carica TaxID=3494 RepID=A0AA88DYA5_FICCA|nr:hypothetical protein TIFTF001_033054 [Ficus carica]